MKGPDYILYTEPYKWPNYLYTAHMTYTYERTRLFILIKGPGYSYLGNDQITYTVPILSILILIKGRDYFCSAHIIHTYKRTRLLIQKLYYLYL